MERNGPILRILGIVVVCGVLAAMPAIQSVTLVRSCHAIGAFGDSSSSVRDFRASSFGVGDLPGYRPVGQSGALSSSSFNIQRRGAGAVPGGSSRTPRADRSFRYASPMTPMRIPASGGPVGVSRAPITAYTGTNPVKVLARALEEDRRKALADPKRPITSLTPHIPGKYAAEMAAGEKEFRNQQYKQAAAHFEAAATLSENSPESLLSLFHTHFAMAKGSYSSSARYLCLVSETAPRLPQVRVHPKNFYGKEADFKSDLARLETHVKNNPRDAEAQFVLGYLDWREKKLAEAKTALSAALKNSQSKELTAGIEALQRGMAGAWEAVAAKAPPIGKPMDLPSAGIRLALPEGFELQRLSDIQRVLVASAGSRKAKDLKIISLSACKVAGDTTLGSFMDFIANALRQGQDVRDLKMVDEADVSFLGGRGLVRLLTGEYHGKKIAALQFCFARELKRPNAPPLRLIYMLSMAAGEKHTDVLLPTLTAVAKTVSLIDFKRPAELPVDAKGHLVKNVDHGYAIRQPNGWAGHHGEMGFEMGRMDFLLGGIVAPKAEVFVTLIPESYTAKTFGEEAIKLKAEKGFEMKVLSSRPVKLGGVGGYQFVVHKREAKAGVTGPSHIDIGRLICMPGPQGKKTLYAIILRCQDCKADRAETIMDRIASGFSLLNTTGASGN